MALYEVLYIRLLAAHFLQKSGFVSVSKLKTLLSGGKPVINKRLTLFLAIVD